jgi:peptidoglycan/xylan/chitin deacetylase (PgdA/CDA1 family)
MLGESFGRAGLVNSRVVRRLRRSAQWVRNKFIHGGIILVYHRVAQLPTDPQLLCVTPAHFAEHLEILRKKYSPISLRELSEGYESAALPERPVVVTFDDGYYDNFNKAKPLLECFDIPATVFVAAGYVGEKREFWSDELERLLLHPGTLPPSLQLTINGKLYQWNLAEGAFYSEEAYERHRVWNVRKKELFGPRQRLYAALHRLIRPLPYDEQQKLLQILRTWAGMKPTGRSTHRTLSADELLSMRTGKLIDIGAHTVTHPVLSAMPSAVQQAEIEGSKARLEEIVGYSVTSFAYPYGGPWDYSAETISTVRQAGFGCACSTYEDNVLRGSERFQLPRRIVLDWDGEEFARKLKGWLGR